jgi:hypothetical protein
MALLMQINGGRSQLSHLLIDLGMKAEARRALDLPEEGLFVVVSQVESRDPGRQGVPSAFSLSARTVPQLLLNLPDAGGDASAVELTEDLFYSGFARILF